MLYDRVAERIEQMIERGSLKRGDRVPSVRKLSDREQVSVSTVLQAYAILESRGLIEARPQSGYFVRGRTTPSPEPGVSRGRAAPVRVQTAAATLQHLVSERHTSLAPLASALPSPELFPTEGLKRAVVKATRRLGAAMHPYEHAPGYLPLREQIARRSLELGCALGPDDIVVTVGAMEALNLCLRAVASPGDVVAIESPTYFGILQVMESLGLRALEIRTHPREGLDVDALAAAIVKKRVRAVVAMPTFSNPLGSAMPDAAKKALVELLARHEIPLIEDDVYGDMPAHGERPRAAKAFDRDGNVLLCSSFSKSFSPGARVGWVAPGRFFEEVKALKFMNTIATPTIMQAAVAEFLQSGGYDRHLRKMRSALARQVEQVADAVARHFPPDTCMTRPGGGYVLWVELPRSIDTDVLHERALREQVSFLPGSVFSACGSFTNCLRLNCGYPYTDRIESSLRILGRLASSMLS
jgi:DNA-binding transcriptional MocR family regulator